MLDLEAFREFREGLSQLRDGQPPAPLNCCAMPASAILRTPTTCLILA